MIAIPMLLVVVLIIGWQIFQLRNDAPPLEVPKKVV
jgi:hypothetical protein